MEYSIHTFNRDSNMLPDKYSMTKGDFSKVVLTSVCMLADMGVDTDSPELDALAVVHELANNITTYDHTALVARLNTVVSKYAHVLDDETFNTASICAAASRARLTDKDKFIHYLFTLFYRTVHVAGMLINKDWNETMTSVIDILSDEGRIKLITKE